MDGARRYVEVLAFVALWMALGWIFHLDGNSYLLIGVPLVVLFQRFVRRRPLQQLWVRDAAAFRFGLVGIVIAGLLILAPGYDLIFVAVPKKSWIVALWLLCAVAGAVFAAFAITQQRASAARSALASPEPPRSCPSVEGRIPRFRSRIHSPPRASFYLAGLQSAQFSLAAGSTLLLTPSAKHSE